MTRPNAWQPIATCPREQSVRVLLRFATCDVSVAYWDAYYAEGGRGYSGIGDGWVEPVSGEELHLHFDYPDYWQPLPPAPSGAAPGEGE